MDALDHPHRSAVKLRHPFCRRRWKENVLQRSPGGDRENAVGPPLPPDSEGSRRLLHPSPVPPHPTVVAPNGLAPLRGAVREKKVDAALLVLADAGGAREEEEELRRAGSGRRRMRSLRRAGSGRRRMRSLRRARHAPPSQIERGGPAGCAAAPARSSVPDLPRRRGVERRGRGGDGGRRSSTSSWPTEQPPRR
jgi:hypothetical protein